MALKNDPQFGDNGTKSIVKALTLSSYTYTNGQAATLPPVATHKGRLIFVTNGAGGQPCLAYCDGTDWKRILIGGAVNTTT